MLTLPKYGYHYEIFHAHRNGEQHIYTSKLLIFFSWKNMKPYDTHVHRQDVIGIVYSVYCAFQKRTKIISSPL